MLGAIKMKKYNDIFDKIEKSNPIPWLYNEGLSHKQVKEFIVVLFKPHFRNKEFFTKYPIEIYLDTWINFFSFRTKPEFKYTELILEFYNQCLDKDSEYTLKTTIEYREENAEGLSKLWSYLNSEKPKEDFFDIDDYLNHILQSIGLIIEGASKPNLKEVFQLNKFLKGSTISKDKADTYDMGNMVDYLENTTAFNKIFKPDPLNIRVSQLRNISYHHNATLEKDGTINCSYGKGDKKKEFDCNLEVLETTLQNVLYYYNAIKLAREIFLWDNYDMIKPLRAHIKEPPKIRREGMLSSLYFSVSKERFKVREMKTDDNYAIMEISDTTNLDVKKRAIHASQMLYNLWWHTDKENLKIEFFDLAGNSRMIASTKSDVCELIGKGEKDLSYLAEKVNFEKFE